MLQNLYEDNMLSMRGLRKEGSKTLLLSFTGIGHQMGGINVQREEFVGSSIKNGNVIFITDKSRSWGNHLDIIKIHQVIQSFGKFNKIIALGNSMGGTNAMVIGPVLGAKIIISFAPQYSVHPKIFPDMCNEQLNKYRDNITKWVFPTADHTIKNKEVLEYIFHGDENGELWHASRFKRKPPLRNHFIVFGSDHNVAERLKSKNCLSSVIESCVSCMDYMYISKIMAAAGLKVGRLKGC